MTEPPTVAPVVAAPSPRVLWAALDAHVGLALWLRAPVPALTSQIARLMQGDEFEIVAQGTPDDVHAAMVEQIPDHRSGRSGPLASDVSILATLFCQLSGASRLRVQLEHSWRSAATELRIEGGELALLCTYAGRGIEWQDLTGTVRRMPQSQVGLFKGLAWPDEAVRVPHRHPAISHLPRPLGARLALRIETLRLT